MDLSSFTADCERCCALCCVAPSFDRSPDFALSKPAFSKCPHLSAGAACSIHDELVPRGFSGCAAYDCHGAGPWVKEVLYDGQRWEELDEPEEMLEVFLVVRVIFEAALLLELALARPLGMDLSARIGEERERLRALLQEGPAELRRREPLEERAASRALLREIGRGAGGSPRNLPVLDPER